MSDRTIWRDHVTGTSDYVPRCSYCGFFKRTLKRHWFFTGLYCLACIQDVLWDNCRTLEEMK